MFGDQIDKRDHILEKPLKQGGLQDMFLFILAILGVLHWAYDRNLDWSDYWHLRMHYVTVAYFVYQIFLVHFVCLSLKNVTMSVKEIETKVTERRTLKLRLKEIVKKISNAWSVGQQGMVSNLIPSFHLLLRFRFRAEQFTAILARN